jgi:hypothetical protein
VARKQSRNIFGPCDQPLFPAVQYLLVSDFTTFSMFGAPPPLSRLSARLLTYLAAWYVLAPTQGGDERCHRPKCSPQYASQSTKQAGAPCLHDAGPESSADLACDGWSTIISDDSIQSLLPGPSSNIATTVSYLPGECSQPHVEHSTGQLVGCVGDPTFLSRSPAVDEEAADAQGGVWTAGGEMQDGGWWYRLQG